MNNKQIDFEFIKKRMKEKRVSQKSLAEATGISTVSISTIMTGKSKMTVSFAIMLADELDITDAELGKVFFGRKEGAA